jgi:hypothetical protein
MRRCLDTRARRLVERRCRIDRGERGETDQTQHRSESVLRAARCMAFLKRIVECRRGERAAGYQYGTNFLETG